MSIKKKSWEVHFSRIIGIFILITGLLILFNAPRIKDYNIKESNDIHIRNIWDFFVAFFDELVRILHHYIGGFPVIAAIIILLFGIFILLIGRTLRRTTNYDYDISIFYIGLTIILMIVMMMTMFQVYSFASFLFIIPFSIHIGYVVYKNELNPMKRKQHYLWIIISYGICYFISQFAMNHNIDAENVKPIDVMSVNLFFVLLWCFSQMSVWISLYLRRSLPVSDKDIEMVNDEKHSRANNNLLTSKIFSISESFYEKSQSLKQTTLEKFNSEEAIAKRKKRSEKWKEIIKIEDDDIPKWMRRPKWLKKSYIEWICTAILFLFTFIEFNNRNGLFLSGEWKLSQTQYVFEWLTLFIMLLLIILYAYFNYTTNYKNINNFGKLFVISALFFEIATTFFVSAIQTSQFSVFITPISFLLLLFVTPAFIIHLKKSF
ncbi:hypothetical protein MXL97_09585 [Mammaliicoccus fleurettii]|uniref:lipoteichoic acid stability factor AuxA n=1 Tax=Mammaliicoccus TaxID=2803850 RepID=UPI001EFBD4DA|nr:MULTISPECIES: hypothetical protein [Mammaliicoccus]MEB6202071.1 hypothetical protein [Mammaliicoccus fleurettii]MEB7805320.1 hypothetical protein [Mammaliicoccus fleurettii]